MFHRRQQAGNPDPEGLRRGPCRLPSVRSIALGLALVAALEAPPAGAQQAPADVGAGWAGPALEALAPVLPEPPDGYLEERRGPVQWAYPAAATSEVRGLMDALPGAWARIEEDLGADVDDALVIRVGRDPDGMKALAPVGFPPPDYASGVAYPRFGVILLTLTAPESWERPDMEAVLTHELSHVALHRAVNGAPVPRWFSEGLAIYQAGEYSLERIRTLWSAVVAGNVVSLDRLESRFPSRAHRVNVAYAQSADMVAFLRRDGHDQRSFRILVRKLGEGVPFEEAVRDGYDATLGTLEQEWRASLQERFQAVPLLVTGGGIWILASILIVLAYVRRRRQNRRRLDGWAEQEAAEEQSLARAQQAVEDELARRDLPPEPPADAVLREDLPGAREPEVPTIEYEGRNHTLH